MTGGRNTRQRRGRKSKGLRPKPIVLVVCEGEKTEPNYFNDLRSRKKVQRDLIRVLTPKNCNGTDPLTLVRCAKEEKRRITREDKIEVHSVWCVFDRDDHHNLASAIDMAQANKFKLAFSNPCFELWPLLHFHKQTAYLRRHECTSLLKQADRIPKYDKNIAGLYDILHPHLPTAQENAESIRKYHRDNAKKSTSNPSTTVDLLVQALLDYPDI